MENWTGCLEVRGLQQKIEKQEKEIEKLQEENTKLRKEK
jgi:cell division protein FtsB